MTSKSACYRQNTLPTENTEKNDEYQQKKRAHIIKKTAQTSGYMDCRKQKDKKTQGDLVTTLLAYNSCRVPNVAVICIRI